MPELPLPSYAPGALAPPMLVTAMTLLAVAVAALIAEKASRESRALLVLACSAALWLGGFAGILSSERPEDALHWARVAYLGIPLIPPAVYGFATQVLRIHRGRRPVVWLGWLVGAGFVLLVPGTDRLVAGVHRYPWGYFPLLGGLRAPFLLFFVGLLLAAQAEFWVRFRRAAPGTYRSRIKWLMIAFAAAYPGLLDFLPTLGIDFYPAGFSGVLAFVAVAAWVIHRYRLVDFTPSFLAEQLLTTMPDPLVVVDRRGRVRIVNDAVATVFGYATGELVGGPLERLAPDEAMRERLRALRAEGAQPHEEMELVGRDGELVAVSVSASALRGVEGEVLGSVLIAHDVRERRRAELLQRQSEQRFRSLIEHISDAILLVNARGEVEFASDSLARVIGYAPEERVGRSAMELLHPEDAPRVRASLASVARTPGLTTRETVRVLHRDGSWRTVEATATNLLDDPAVRGVVVAYHDVTERLRAEAALRDRDEQLRQAQKMEALGRLAGGVAHDFNNLLTVITGQARLLLDEETTAEEVRSGLEEILRAGDRAGEVTRQLLAVSRRQMLQPRVLDLNAVLGEMEVILRRLIGEHIRLSVSPTTAPARVRAEPGQLEQVILNLALNARDAMPQGGMLSLASRVVRLDEAAAAREGVEPGAYVRLTVADTGTGIEPAALPHVFEPFFTTKELGKGTGLGLSTVYGVVQQGRGFVRLESEPGRGTRLEVHLPQTAADEAPEPREDGEAEVRAGRETVLLVEDDRAVRALAALILQRSGYTVLEAESGRGALRLCDQHAADIDLLLTDVVMPEMGGRELAEAVELRSPGMKVLYMSGYTDDTVVHHGVRHEGVPFLEKPFTPAALARKVREVLEA